MKAGQALGLLAGMGALSALGRGTDLQGNRFTGLLDMIDGGGGGKSGDRFQGGGLLSMLGNLFAKPYEAQQRVEDIANRTSARNVTPNTTTPPVNMTTGTPITEYSDSLLPPVLAPIPAAAVDPRKFDPSTEPSVLTEAQKEAIVMGQQVVPASPNVLSGGIVQPISPDLVEGVDSPPIAPAPIVKGPNLYPSTGGSDISMPPFSANPPSAAAMTPPIPAPADRNPQLASFNRRMETVPEMLRGTEIEGMYRDYLLNGGLGTFAQFTNQSMATEDPAVARSPTPPAMATPSAIIPPTVPVAPAAAGLGMSDADQMMAIRSAIMRDPKMVGALEEAFGVDMVREALAGLRMVGGSPVVSKAPLTRRDQRGLLPTMPITRFN